MTFALRGGPVKASTCNVTVALPCPSRPDVIEIHGAGEMAVQSHAVALARTLTLRSPPVAPTDS